MLTRLIAKIETSAKRVTSTTSPSVTTTAVPPIRAGTNAATSEPKTSSSARPANGNEMTSARRRSRSVTDWMSLKKIGAPVSVISRPLGRRAPSMRGMTPRNSSGRVRSAIIAYAVWPSGAAWRGLSRWVVTRATRSSVRRSRSEASTASR